MQTEGTSVRLTRAVRGEHDILNWKPLSWTGDIENLIRKLQELNRDCCKEVNKAAVALANKPNAMAALDYTGYPSSFLFEILTLDRNLALELPLDTTANEQLPILLMHNMLISI
ncbi:hypothetical protein C5167_001340 [Papaver somniferum]|uniref:Uncharacterized protein n=1 Tax=Papaver somniferum TaxID=3469 RepID=A0A4Y7KXT1_PAPSO|nr:hypothetical protein C5167_001340 [Papaver somniferum]